MNIPLSIVIPVKNDAKNLAECLPLLIDFDDVQVVDSQSSDETHEVVAKWNRKIVQFVWNGKFPKKRNWALRNLKFKYSWILFLDADERMTLGWKNEIAEFLTSDRQSDCDVIVCTYDNWFAGRMLRHGDAMRKTAVVRIGAAEYEKIDEDHWSNLDMEIHEHLQPLVREIRNSEANNMSAVTINTSLRIHAMTQRLEHHDCRSIESHWQKHLQYAQWEVGRYRQLSQQPERWELLTSRQKKKYRHIKSFWLAPIYFVVCYFFKLGFLDGWAGFRFAVFKFHYFRYIRAIMNHADS